MASLEKENALVAAGSSDQGQEMGVGESILGTHFTSTGTPPATSTVPGGSLLEIALHHASQGWPVFPLVGKRPLTPNGVYDASTDPDKIAAMFEKHQRTATGVGGACGGRVVVDVDPRNGGQFPEGLPPTRVHYSGRGDGGCHLIYTLPDGVGGLKSSTQDISEGVDIKTGEGSYVVLPGSTHPDTGGRYTANTVDPVPIPADLLQQLRESRGSSAPRGQSLASLLANPPEVGGRNEWLTKVAGHYARQLYGKPEGEDSYHQAVGEANRLLRNPLGADEVAKTADSIWQAECEQREEDLRTAEQLSVSNGWLVSGGDCIKTTILLGSRENTREVLGELAQFDLRVVGRFRDEVNYSMVYDCELRTRRNPGVVERLTLRSTDLGNPRVARQLLASRALVVSDRTRFAEGDLDWCARLLMYLDSQEAPERVLATHLGWNEAEGGFVVPGGVVDSEGYRDTTQVASDSSFDWIGDQYGFKGTPGLAREVLAEVLHFQEPDVTSVFASWWAAVLVKQWIRPRTSLFPFCAVEAASESGKTTGFFSLMTELAGSTTGEGRYTVPVLRNRLAANFNGLTWVDDMDDPRAAFETIRTLTAGGSLSKMNQHNEPVEFKLVGSLLLSGENLDLDTEKAMEDRALKLKPTTPRGRRSHRDASRNQWLDVLDLREKLADLGGGHQLTGHYLQAVAGLEAQVRQWVREEQANSPGGRQADRNLTIRVGARVLEHLVGPIKLPDAQGVAKTPVEWVADWIHSHDSQSASDRLDATGGTGMVIDGDNTLTMLVIPKYLASRGTWTLKENADIGRSVAHDEEAGQLWVSPNRLAQWWQKENPGKTGKRTESGTAFLDQVKALRTAHGEDVVTKGKKRLDGNTNRNQGSQNVWVLSGIVYETIMERVSYH